MIFTDDFLKEEVRCEHLVTAKMKKIWGVELQILEVFDQICKKYDLKYWAGYGTLLGAVRHKGFIPWDNDIDLVMLRPDYERMRGIIGNELPDYYFFQDSFTDDAIMTFYKIRDSRTTAYEKKFPVSCNQGISIDIFPLDDIYMGENPVIHEIETELYECMMFPEVIQKRLQESDESLVLEKELLLDFIQADPRDQIREFETFLANHFGESTKVGYFPSSIGKIRFGVDRLCYSQTEPALFEMKNIPIPIGVHTILCAEYGDYMKPVQGKSAHEEAIMNPDLPYLEYYKQNGLI